MKFNKYKPLLIVALLIIAIVFLRDIGVQDKIEHLREFITAMGFWGYFIFIAIYALLTVFAFPGSAMTIIAGSMFGSIMGLIVVSIGSTLGAALAFLVARYALRNYIENWVGKNEKFKKLDTLTLKHGEIIVAVTRLLPIFPFTWLNYGFGLTKIKFKTYILWSWLCMIPGTALYVMGADIFTKALETGRIPFKLVVFFVVVIFIIGLLAKKASGILKSKKETD